MAIYALHALSPTILAMGHTNDRHIIVMSGSATVSVGGTYTLRGPTGAVVSGCSGLTITAGQVSVPVPDDITLGSGYTEEINITSGTGSGVNRWWTAAAHVWTWSMDHEEVLVSPVHFLFRYPQEIRYASGQTSWESQAQVASGRVMRDAVRLLPSTGSQLVSRTDLFGPGLEAMCAEVFRSMSSRGNPGARMSMEMHEAAYQDEWREILAGIDTTGDGVRDAQARPVDAPGGPPPGPLA